MDVDASVESVSVITGTTLGKLSGVTGASRLSSVISRLTTGEVRGMSTDVDRSYGHTHG